MHQYASQITFNHNVPEEIHSRFNIAKNLYVYSWYCYPFHQIAELKALSTLEKSLRIKLNSGTTLAPLIKKAINQGFITDQHFVSNPRINKTQDSTEHVWFLFDYLPKYRNDLAHGSNMLHPWSSHTLITCSDFINGLFHE